MNRGLLAGVKNGLFVPEQSGGGDPARDAQTLALDSTQPGGVRPIQSPLYNIPGGYTSSGTTAQYQKPAEATLYAFPIKENFATDVRLVFVGVHSNVAGSAGSLIRLGLFRDDNAGRPGSLVADYGTLDTSGAGNLMITTPPTIIAFGYRYWWGSAVQGAAATVATFYSYNPLLDSGAMNYMVPTPTVNNNGDIYSGGNSNSKVGFTRTGITGTFPGSFGTPDNVVGPNVCPRISYKVVAI